MSPHPASRLPGCDVRDSPRSRTRCCRPPTGLSPAGVTPAGHGCPGAQVRRRRRLLRGAAPRHRRHHGREAGLRHRAAGGMPGPAAAVRQRSCEVSEALLHAIRARRCSGSGACATLLFVLNTCQKPGAGYPCDSARCAAAIPAHSGRAGAAVRPPPAVRPRPRQAALAAVATTGAHAPVWEHARDTRRCCEDGVRPGVQRVRACVRSGCRRRRTSVVVGGRQAPTRSACCAVHAGPPPPTLW